MLRSVRAVHPVRWVLLCAIGAAASSAATADADPGACMQRIEAMRETASDTPSAIADRSAFDTALDHAEGWSQNGDRRNCHGWLNAAEALLSDTPDTASRPEPAPKPGSERTGEARVRADVARDLAEDRVVERRERGEAVRTAAQRRSSAVRRNPPPAESGGERLTVIEPAWSRPDRGAFEPAAPGDVSPSLPAPDAMSDLERSARRRLAAGPDTTLAEIDDGAAFEPRSEDATALQAVRFDGAEVELGAHARQAVRRAAVALGDRAVIAVRGDSSEALFAERADALVQALSQEGVSRSDIHVIASRSHRGAPGRLELAVLPQTAEDF